MGSSPIGLAAWYDVSGASGSFAIPINTLTDGHTIRLELTNTNATSRQITFPLGYTTLAAVTLTNQETFIAGYYAQPSGITNVGFRDLIVLRKPGDGKPWGAVFNY